MATDVTVVLANLLGFFELDNKIMISVGPAVANSPAADASSER
jgi:hypothetical protein